VDRGLSQKLAQHIRNPYIRNPFDRFAKSGGKHQAGSRRQKAGSRRQKAGSRRQEAESRRQRTIR